MIIDKIENARIYHNISESITEGLAFLQSLDIETIHNGKHTINGDLLYAIISEYTTKAHENNIMEAHKEYVDIQYILEGTEQIGFTTLAQQKVTKAYDQEGDYALFEAPLDVITLKKGMFAIFFPDDLYLPGLQTEKSENVKKVVVKVKW